MATIELVQSMHTRSSGRSDRLDSAADRLEQRRASGRVRECHGELHARNVVLRDAQLVAFDCLEFAEGFRWIDVSDEVAFLVADLEARGRGAHAPAASARVYGHLAACAEEVVSGGYHTIVDATFGRREASARPDAAISPPAAC